MKGKGGKEGERRERMGKDEWVNEGERKERRGEEGKNGEGREGK